MLSILIFFFCFPSVVFSISNCKKIDLPLTAVGPESSTFDSWGQGPYTAISDGRVVKYNGPGVGYVDYVITSPFRSKRECDGTNNPELWPKCGRPIGIAFYFLKNQLFIADAYRGLLVAGPNERLATQIATSAEGLPFKFLDGLDVDQLTGNVYFTDASSVYTLRQFAQAVAANDASGRLLKYDPKTGQVTVLQRGLSGAAGVAVSLDSSYVLVTEYIANRIQKFWLRGPKANTSEILVTLEGRPDNIKRTPAGNFLVAVTIQNASTQTIVATAVTINGVGNIRQSVSLGPPYDNTSISEVLKFRHSYYIGSLMADFLGVCN
ncbi:protein STRICTOSIDINE SYNTHASE-LIKE 12-like [Ziziphus jujuba]|uniref:Protein STRICTOSIDINE SYNTHASE-LIKE 12-like n=1 Tax=Ziziphus jujuba TaxID=326968 RepID=A0A6P6G7B7_ZIZJJ|nr:protein STRICTOSIDINE SYNTHASE-LIKE 12-like [Ziziphus jujuba]